MKVLFAGDIVGNRALQAVCNWVRHEQENNTYDFVIANAENAAEGKGLTVSQAKLLLNSGIDCITLGNHAFGNWALAKYIGTEERLIKPANTPDSWPGNDLCRLEKNGQVLFVFSLLGNAFMKGAYCPFAKAKEQIETIREREPETPILIDFHAEATAEKQALAWMFDGTVSAIIGTHTHVQTADERILPKGTALLTDVGMCGPVESVIGMEISQSIRRLADNLPAQYRCANGPLEIRAVVLEIDPVGITRYIKRIQMNEEFSGQWQS